MAQYQHLPLFNDVYDFTIYFYKLSKGFPRDCKYGIAAEIQKLLDEAIDGVMLANNHTKKEIYLENLLILIERIKIKMRILFDLGVVKTTSYEYMAKRLADISKQANAWHSWAKTAH